MDRAEQLRQVLSARGLTLYRVSEQSAQIFGRSSRFFIPHNLYYDFRDPTLIPTIQQMLALSHITDYRLYDWLAVFGFDLDRISALRLLVPRKRTTLLDSSVHDTHAWIPWFAARPSIEPVPRIAPLGQFLAQAPPELALELLARNRRRFLYAKVGEEDFQAFPDLAPGSIVRVDARRSEEAQFVANKNIERVLFLVEHDFGLTCSRLIVLGKDRILLYSPNNTCAQRELRLGKDARILGIVDAEIRRVTAYRTRQKDSRTKGVPNTSFLIRPAAHESLRELLRTSRLSMGLSFREASSVSRTIANSVSNRIYFAAASTLSDYETLSAPPRHLEKILTLCVLYSIDFDHFLRTSGLPIEQEGHDPIPDELMPGRLPGPRAACFSSEEKATYPHGSFLDMLLKEWEEVPLFLRHSLKELSGQKNFSLLDLFWVGGDETPIHRLLINATFAIVNRRVKRPIESAFNAYCEQPIYLLLKRDGSYLCGHCVLNQGNLIVHSYPGGPSGKQQFKNGIDAEVVGQVTSIVRRLL
jgi:hypothetical protein